MDLSRRKQLGNISAGRLDSVGDPRRVTQQQLDQQIQENENMDINSLVKQQMAGPPPDMMEDAIAAWTEINGREPATDDEFAEIETLLQQANAGDPREQIVGEMLSGEVDTAAPVENGVATSTSHGGRMSIEGERAIRNRNTQDNQSRAYKRGEIDGEEAESRGMTGPWGTEQQGPAMDIQSFVPMNPVDAIMAITGDKPSSSEAKMIKGLNEQQRGEFYEEVINNDDYRQTLDQWFGGSEEEE